MRQYWPAITIVLTLCGGLYAQPQQQASNAPHFSPAQDSLDALLLQWEQKMKTVETLSAQLVRTKDDKTFGTREIFEGQATYMKPNLAMVHLSLKGQPAKF